MVSLGLDVVSHRKSVVSASFGVVSHWPKFWDKMVVAECVSMVAEGVLTSFWSTSTWFEYGNSSVWCVCRGKVCENSLF